MQQQSTAWMAFTMNGKRFTSDTDTYGSLPWDEISAFSFVVGSHLSVYVNLRNGMLAIDGNIYNNREVERRRCEQSEPFQLHYLKRASMDVSLSGQGISEELLKSVKCGWKTSKTRCFFTIDLVDKEGNIYPAGQEKVEISIQDVEQ